MTLIRNLHLLLISLSLLSVIPKSISAPTFLNLYFPYHDTFAPNSQYQKNLNSIFQSLASNAATNPSVFHFTVSGNSIDDVAYGLFLCRGDLDVRACSDCVTFATTTSLPQKCPMGRKSVIWFDECTLRYSDTDFSNEMYTDPGYILHSNVHMASSMAMFPEILNKTMKEVVVQAANDSLSTTMKFATAKANITSSVSLYALGQCTPDLNTTDCKECLTDAVEELPLSDGARVLYTSCNIRYEVYPFFNLSTAPSPSPAPAEEPMGSNVGAPTEEPMGSSASGKQDPKWRHAYATGSFMTRRKPFSHKSFLVAILTSTTILIFLTLGTCIYLRKRKAMETYDDEIDKIKMAESLEYDLSTIRRATSNFSTEYKVGEGGFGVVYKGKLESGQEVAIKRLSKTSGQGVIEFKTEVVLIAKLRHNNLVKLLGFCVASKEKILVYEYLPNSSLEKFLFDPMKITLDWQTRLKIIVGIARGLLYLHEDSPLKVIHRDMKPSNILLDEAMNPKISDFGLAKLLGVDQTQSDTNRIVGTYGYMAPEYALTGHYSVKSDIYSFGVIVLEIVSGQKNRYFGHVQHEEALIHRVWRLWNERKLLDSVDTTLSSNMTTQEVITSIHIGLLCIQEDAAKRPKIRSIIAALSDQSIDLPLPKAPRFFGNTYNVEDHCTVDEHASPPMYTGAKTITDLSPRE